MGRHGHQHQSHTNGRGENLPRDSYAMFEAIHELTARALRMNQTKARNMFGTVDVPLDSLVGSKMPYYRTSTTTVSPQERYRQSLYRPIGGDADFPWGSRFTTTRPTTPKRRFKYDSQYVYPGGILATPEVSSTRRPLPDESPFYRVVEPSSHWEFMQLRDSSDGIMEGQRSGVPKNELLHMYKY